MASAEPATGDTVALQAATTEIEQLQQQLAVQKISDADSTTTKAPTPQEAVHAAQDGHPDVVAAFIASSSGTVDINYYYTDPTTGARLIHIAAENGHVEVVRVLVEAGADVNVTVGGYVPGDPGQSYRNRTPLIMAIEKGHHSVIDYLLMCPKLDVNVGDREWALGHAAIKSDLPLVKRLLGAGADIHKPNHVLCLTTDLSLCQLLVENGADLHAVDHTAARNTPLAVAIIANNLPLCKLYLKQGDLLNTPCSHGTRLPVHVAASSHDSTVLEMLLDLGADVNAIEHNKYTPLHVACRARSLACVKALIARKAKVNEKDVDGCTPLRAYFNSPGMQGELSQALEAAGGKARGKIVSGPHGPPCSVM